MKFKILLAAGLFSASCFAQNVHTVTSPYDEMEAGTLRYILENASEGDVIDIPASVGTINLGDELIIGKSLTIQAGNNTIQVETPKGSSYRVFQIGVDTPVEVIISNLILKGGNLTGKASDAKDLQNCGGVILLNSHADLTLNNVTLTDGAGNYAGALYAAENAAIKMTDCYVAGNQATTNNAGGVYINGGCLFTIKGCLFESNTSVLDGAGLTTNNAQGTISGCVFLGNQSATSTSSNNGGAYFNTGTKTKAIASVENTTFSENVAANKGGGAFTASGGAITTFTNCTFYKNSNNNSIGTGALYVRNSTLNLINCTVAGNSSTGDAAGIRIEGASPVLGLVNTIVAYNYVGTTVSDINAASGKLVGSSNVIGVMTGGASELQNTIAFDYNGGSALFAEYEADGNKIPLLKDNGGIQCRGEVINTIALIETGGDAISVATEAGIPELSGYSIPAKDQRGYGRNVQYPCVGAYELGGTNALQSVKQDVSISVYPNPAKDFVKIDADAEIVSVRVVSIMGQVVGVKYPVQGSIDLQNIPAGVYLLRIETSKGIVTERLVIG